MRCASDVRSRRTPAASSFTGRGRRSGCSALVSAPRRHEAVDLGRHAPYYSNVHANKRRAVPVTGDALCNVPCFKGDLVARLLRGMPEAARLDRALRVFGALADRHRLRILHALRECEELCVCDVAHVLGTSVSTASHHLRKLRDMGILKDRDDGRMVYYSLQDSSAAALVSAVLTEARP